MSTERPQSDLAKAIEAIESTSPEPYLRSLQVGHHIDEMRAGRADGLAPEQFAKLVEIALSCFPDPSPPDEAIRTNPATPALIRYVLRALRTYQDMGASGNKDDKSRAAILAREGLHNSGASLIAGA